jgi:prepilin-type processing-associated H-X9-DG protein
LHYDPPGDNGTVQNVKLAFSGKILGVICLTSPLCNTDGVLGYPGTAYDEKLGARGMELGDEVLQLSSDMKSMTVNRFIVTGAMEEARIITEPGGMSFSSYGVNGMVNRFLGDANKILLVEYNKIVADVVGPDAKDVWTDQIAPRHFGAMNVLFGDGHVDAMRPDAIDPRNADIQSDLWRPTAVAP